MTAFVLGEIDEGKFRSSEILSTRVEGNVRAGKKQVFHLCQ